MMQQVFQFCLQDEASTLALGAALATCISGGMRIYLKGEVGAGKTTFTRGLLRGLGVKGTLRSPSYALVEPYELAIPNVQTVYHFDFYRLEHTPLAWREAGFAEAFEAPNAAIVEWPEYAHGLPTPDLMLQFMHDGEQRRVNALLELGRFRLPLSEALQTYFNGMP